MAEIVTTQFLVLRKTPYSETSLVLAGLSPDVGQVHFLVRGARRLGRRQFPVADLFRILNVQYRCGRGELHSWQSAEVATDFSGVARDARAFAVAGWLARFALGNVTGEVPHPRFFAALQVALGRLVQAAASAPADAATAVAALTAPVMVGAGMVFLDEHGLLPDYVDQPRLARQREWLLAMGAGAAEPRPLPPEDWDRLRDWVFHMLRFSDCRVPNL